MLYYSFIKFKASTKDSLKHDNDLFSAHTCPNQPNPYKGGQSCSDTFAPHYGCSIACNDNNRRTSRYHPNLYTCGPSGSWNPTPSQRFIPVRYPSCGCKLLLKQELTSYCTHLHASYCFKIFKCSRGRDHMVVGFYNYLHVCNQCLSPLMLWVRILLRWGVLTDNIMWYFVSDLWQVVGFRSLLWFPPPIKLTAMI